ncbi:hypothetical protein BRC19_02650 [Candidatus Saccharibacteria bacterium QS_5_54_17]|nr:MAG: hypothetical protein BRC19_02650 [Candidatus Saccharibacteria bacterium QS_5_54_17]
MRHVHSMRKTKTTPKITIVVVITVVAVAGLLAQRIASTSAQSLQQLEGEISQLEERIQDSRNRLQELRDKKDTLKNKLEIIRTDINKKEAELRQTRQEIASTEAEIRETKQKLRRQKKLMQENAATLYKEGDPTTLEMLFSSDSFSDFIDRKQYLDSVKESLDEAAAKVKQLQGELEDKKAKLEDKRRQQKSEKRALQARRNEQQRLLEKTRGREERYQQLLSQQQEELQRKRQQKRQAYQRYLSRNDVELVAGDPNKGGYPDRWANPPRNDRVDEWGMYNRQCTSYAAWRVHDDGKHMPEWGRTDNADAKYWYNLARRDDIPTGGSPREGAIAVWREGDGMGDTYGHVAYVENVNDDGSIWVSQYNVTPGEYNEMGVSKDKAAQLDYVYFQ